MIVDVKLTGFRITETKPPDAEDLDTRISGEVQFELTIAEEIPLRLISPFADCYGERMAKAAAFDQLGKLVNELRAAIGKARAANGL
jgi:hypothetical protein